MTEQFKEELRKKLTAMDPFDAMEMVMEIYKNAFRNRHEENERGKVLIAALHKDLLVVRKISDDLAGMISKAEYNGDELQQGVAAWEPVAQTMRDGFMAGFHGIVEEAISKINAHITAKPAPHVAP